MGKREKQGLDNNQGWEKEKIQGLVKINKEGNSVTSPNNNPEVCILQLRVLYLNEFLVGRHARYVCVDPV